MIKRVSLIQLLAFSAAWKRMGLGDEDLRALESAILIDPEGAPFMRGTGGLRKIRFSPSAMSGGKSGGARACYAYFPEFGLVYLCAVFPKNEKANLTAKESAAYRDLLQRLSRYLKENFTSKGITP